LFLDLAQPTQQAITSPAPPLEFSAYTADATTSNLVQFLHATCFSPVQSTLIKAIDNGHFATWPSFTAANIQRFLPKSPAIIMGHLDQVRKNQQTTKAKPPKSDDDSNDVIPSLPTTDGKCTQFVYAAILLAPTESGQIYTDQMGRFPVASRRGNKCIMILYDYDSYSILAEPMRSRTDDEIIRSYQTLHDRLVAAGLKPRLQKLDNEASRRLKQFLDNDDIEFQLVPPHSHRRNADERAIRTFENHFIAGLCSPDKLFP
jgi:hypothetical protein